MTPTPTPVSKQAGREDEQDAVVEEGDKMEIDQGTMGGMTKTAVTHEEEWKSEQFWSDLRGFLVQRLKSEEEGNRLADVFRKTAA